MLEERLCDLIARRLLLPDNLIDAVLDGARPAATTSKISLRLVGHATISRVSRVVGGVRRAESRMPVWFPVMGLAARAGLVDLPDEWLTVPGGAGHGGGLKVSTSKINYSPDLSATVHPGPTAPCPGEPLAGAASI